MLTRTYLSTIFALILTTSIGTVRADLIIEHNGSTDPNDEGFGEISFGPPSLGEGLDDLGAPAWSIKGSARRSQFGYQKSLTAGESADLLATGFTMTMESRVLLGTAPEIIAPVYEDVNQVAIAGASAKFLGRRYDMYLGLDANEDTVAVLPDSIDNNGPGNAVRARTVLPAQTFVFAGNGYRQYQLVFDPGEGTADFFVDGIEVFTGYAGHTSFAGGGDRFAWTALSGGRGNFRHTQFSSGTAVPEPSSCVLLLIGGIGGLLTRRKRH